MAKIQIQQPSLTPRRAKEPSHVNGSHESNPAWGSGLSLRVEWISNKLSGDRWGATPYLFVKLKILDEHGDAHFEDWAGGFYLTAGDVRVSSAIFALETPLADGDYTIRVFRSTNCKTWVADGTSKFTVGEPRRQVSPSQDITRDIGIPFQAEDEPLRWAAGAR